MQLFVDKKAARKCFLSAPHNKFPAWEKVDRIPVAGYG
jgi:hypothetical protein